MILPTLSSNTHFAARCMSLYVEFNVFQQAWCQHILVDLVENIHAMMTLEILQTEEPPKTW